MMKAAFSFLSATMLLAFSFEIYAQDAPQWTTVYDQNGVGHPRGWTPPQNNGGNYQTYQQTPGPSPAQIAAQQQAAKEAARQASAERQRQEEVRKAAEQAAFDTEKQRALANLKGISSAESLQLKSLGSDGSFGLKGLSDSPASFRSKVLNDSAGLKDAVADNSGDRKLFENKKAIQDALTAKAHGGAGIEQLANCLPGSSVNPELRGALERAKAETNLRFDDHTSNAGEFSTIVIARNPNQTSQAESEPIHVPASLGSDPRFKKLIIERNALLNQAHEIEAQLKTIEDDLGSKQDAKRLTQLDQLKTTDSSLKGMAGYLNNLAGDAAKGSITIDKLNFDETPSPKKGLDSTQVPSPKL